MREFDRSLDARENENVEIDRFKNSLAKQLRIPVVAHECKSNSDKSAAIFFLTQLLHRKLSMLSMSKINLKVGVCRQNVDPPFWTPFWTPFSTPFWTEKKREKKKGKKNKQTTDRLSLDFYRRLLLDFHYSKCKTCNNSLFDWT